MKRLLFTALLLLLFYAFDASGQRKSGGQVVEPGGLGRFQLFEAQKVLPWALREGLRVKPSYGVHEVFYYKVSKASLKKIAYAKSVDIRTDSYSGVLAQDTREVIKQLVAATE